MHPPSSWKYVNKGLVLILSVFVVATITSIVYLSFILLKLDKIISQSGQSVRTDLVLQDLYIGLDDLESSARGYIITGDQQYLATYNQALKQLPTSLSTIKSNPLLDLTSPQRQSLQTTAEAKITAMEQLVATRSGGDEEAARGILLQGTSNQLMNRIRSDVTAISSQSLGGIRPRQQQSHANLQRALSVAGALSVFVLGICAALVWYFQRTIQHERAVEGTKNEFLSLASHQLRTPATNVKQYVGLLLDGYLGDLTTKQQDALRIAYKNNELEIRIMNDLLDVAKLDLQRIQLHKQPVNIVSVVRQVVKSYDQAAADRGQTLTLKAPPSLVAEVDRTYFKGVVEKLLDNAVRYSKNNTQIVVRIRGDESRNMFEVIVRDRGLGINKKELSKLFLKFSRLTNEFSATSEGSGLGLYWVKQIMALHGGSVDVVTLEGRGSKFTARSPLR